MADDSRRLFDTDLVAVDRVALRVVMPGIHYDLSDKTIPKNWIHSDAPLPVFKDIPKVIRNNQSFENLTGLKQGRFTVIGLSSTVKGRWVVRCRCGAFELRTAKALTNQRNSSDRCLACRREVTRKRYYEYCKTGSNRKSYEEMMDESV